MSRRASSSAGPFWAVGLALILAIAAFGGWQLSQKVSDPFRTLTSLNVEEYLDGAASMRGNTYKVEGTVGSKLAYSPDGGSLYAFEVSSPNGVMPVPVLAPADFSGHTIQKGQKLFLSVEVRSDGVLKLLDLRKS